jgi:type VI protein secretion system component VasK
MLKLIVEVLDFWPLNTSWYWLSALAVAVVMVTVAVVLRARRRRIDRPPMDSDLRVPNVCRTRHGK